MRSVIKGAVVAIGALTMLAGILALPVVLYLGNNYLKCASQQDAADAALEEGDLTRPQLPGAVPLGARDADCESDDHWVSVTRRFRLPRETPSAHVVAHHQRLAARHGWRLVRSEGDEAQECLVKEVDGTEVILTIFPEGEPTTREYSVSVSTWPC
ncbi:hypothetical protein [Nonomuraea soli]|uniref:Uncharacterized protein n=1 Tax=Nonomuraea soli TaxID=1032476 RepID=A0A7W0HUE9_9ACTN|nr:hypothetical protein [Nonomuraea soli]MBA2896035.1 hypothetical protein [Nonomuraea soli]